MRITDEGDGSLGVAWDVPPSDGGSEITGYRVQWKSGDEEFETTRQAEVSGTSHTITDLVNGAAYTVRVLAVSDVGVSQPSGEVSGTPSTTPARANHHRVDGGSRLDHGELERSRQRRQRPHRLRGAVEVGR